MSVTARLPTRLRIEQGIAAWDRDAYSEALEIFADVVSGHPQFPDAHHHLGLCKAMLGDPEGALDEFEKALELAPTCAEAHFNRGIVLNELGRHDEAAVSFKRAHELDTRDGTRFPSHVGNQIANAHAQLGDLYMAADSPANAVAQYRAALDVRPRYLDVREKLGNALLADDDADGARIELEAVLDEAPGVVDARLRLGVALQRLGNLEGAVAEWKRVLSLRPQDRRVQAYLATVGSGAENARERLS